jgi:hypothetical protein
MYVWSSQKMGCNLINTDMDIGLGYRVVTVLYNAAIKSMTNLRYPDTHILSKNLFTLKSVTINKQTHTCFP